MRICSLILCDRSIARISYWVIVAHSARNGRETSHPLKLSDTKYLPVNIFFGNCWLAARAWFNTR